MGYQSLCVSQTSMAKIKSLMIEKHSVEMWMGLVDFLVLCMCIVTKAEWYWFTIRQDMMVFRFPWQYGMLTNLRFVWSIILRSEWHFGLMAHGMLGGELIFEVIINQYNPVKALENVVVFKLTFELFMAWKNHVKYKKCSFTMSGSLGWRNMNQGEVSQRTHRQGVNYGINGSQVTWNCFIGHLQGFEFYSGQGFFLCLLTCLFNSLLTPLIYELICQLLCLENLCCSEDSN